MKKFLLVLFSFIIFIVFLGMVGYIAPTAKAEKVPIQIARKHGRHHGGYHRGHHGRHGGYHGRHRHRGPQPPPCYIASCVYGKYNEKTDTLREFRNKYLMKNPLGRNFISFYYDNSPKLVEKIGNNKILKNTIGIFLLPIVGTAYIMNICV